MAGERIAKLETRDTRTVDVPPKDEMSPVNKDQNPQSKRTVLNDNINLDNNSLIFIPTTESRTEQDEENAEHLPPQNSSMITIKRRDSATETSSFGFYKFTGERAKILLSKFSRNRQSMSVRNLASLKHKRISIKG